MTEQPRRRGTGSIYREGDHWRAQIRIVDPFSGGSKTIRRRASSRDEARDELKKLQEGDYTQKATTATTVAEYLRSYQENSLPSSGLAVSSIAMHKLLITNPLTPTLGEVKLRDFDTATAEQWLVRLDSARTKQAPPRPVKAGRKRKPPAPTRPLAPATKHKAFYVLSKALDVAVRDKLITENPLKALRPPKETRVTVPATSAADFDNVIVPAVAGMRIEPLVIVVGLTGCRVGEALGLRWKDVDLEAETITIRRSTAETDTTKTGRIRTVPLVPEAVATLKARRKVQRIDKLAMGAGWADTQGLVFTTGAGAPVDVHNARRDLAKVLKAKKIDTRRPFHSLRHGLAARLLQRELPMYVVSAILGHSSIKLTVDLYGHVEPVMHAAAFAKAMGK